MAWRRLGSGNDLMVGWILGAVGNLARCWVRSDLVRWGFAVGRDLMVGKWFGVGRNLMVGWGRGTDENCVGMGTNLVVE